MVQGDERPYWFHLVPQAAQAVANQAIAGVNVIRGIFQPQGHQLILAEERLAAARHTQYKTVAAALSQPVNDHQISCDCVLPVEYPG